MEYDIRTLLGDHALPSIWAMKHRFLGGAPLQFYSKKDPFKHRPFHVMPMDDWSQTIVVRKARQMGFTEVFISKMIHLATLIRSMTVYTLPKDRKAEEIARTRIDIVGKEMHPDRFDESVQSTFINWRSLMHKQFAPKIGGGESNLIVTGSWNEDIGESTACDVAELDEYDRMKPGVVTAFKMSLRSSKIGALRLFSTPSFPNMGVDEQIKTTDNKKWVWTCSGCGHRQPLTRANLLQTKGPDSLISRLETHDKTAHFDPGTFIIGCIKCRKEFNRMNDHAEWVPERPGAEASGYSTSQLDCAWISADTIMADCRDQETPGLRQWYNYSLGEAYAGDAGRVAEGLAYSLVEPDLSTITDRNRFDHRFKNAKVAIGIDWGKSNWFLALGQTPEFAVPLILDVQMFVDTNDPDDTVRAALEFIRLWRAEAAIADAGYGQDRNPKLYKELGERFYACQYPAAGTRQATSTPIFGQNPTTDPSPIVAVGRAPRLKQTILRLTSQPSGYRIIAAPRPMKYLDLLDLHFRGVAITAEPTKTGDLIDEAVTLGPDHWLHTVGYADIGLEYIAMRNQRIIELDAPGSIAPKDGQIDVMPSPEDVVELLDGIGAGFDPSGGFGGW